MRKLLVWSLVILVSVVAIVLIVTPASPEVSEPGDAGEIEASRLDTSQEDPERIPTFTPAVDRQDATATPVSIPTNTPTPPAAAAPATPTEPATCTDAWGTSRDGYLIRSGPGTNHEPTGQLVAWGEPICVLAETGDWVRLRKRDGASGYTHRDGIAYQQPVAQIATSTPQRAAPAAPVAAAGHRARLDTLAVAPHSHQNTYDRDDWGGGWNDADRDCQNTRHEVLQVESQAPVAFSDSRRCRVATGLWVGPWSGETFTRASDLDIDHHVPLKNAHISGGALWSRARKVAYYNDMELAAALQAMKNSLNRTKGASGPEAWKPPLRDTWCRYAQDWIDVKTKYSLSVTRAEKSALHSMLDTCGAQAAPPSANRALEVVPTATPVLAPAAAPVQATAPGGQVSLTSCQARDEKVTLTNSGTQPIDISGYVIHDEGAKHTHTFPSGSVMAPGATWTLVSGSGAAADPSRDIVLFAARNIWNNDKDTAYLKQGDTLIASLDCK